MNWRLFTSQFNKVFKSISSDLCDYCDAYILVIKNIVVVGADYDKNDTLVDEAEFIDIAIPMYNLIE